MIVGIGLPLRMKKPKQKPGLWTLGLLTATWLVCIGRYDCVVPELYESETPLVGGPVNSNRRMEPSRSTPKIVRSEALCPARCKCVLATTSTEVTCVNASNGQIPSNVPKAATILTVSSDSIRSLTGQSLAHLVNLEQLTLSGNGLQEIGQAAFQSLPKLGLLDLSNNQLGTNLTDSVFVSLANLSALNLSHNGLVALSNTCFEGLTNLTSLDLSYNAIEHINDEAFLPLVKLELLDLSGNQITNLSSAWFKPMPKLRTLLLRENQIVHIENNTFQRLSHLDYLDLSSANIVTLNVKSFQGLHLLRYLSLENNHLTELTKDIMEPMRNLQILILSSNFLSNIDASPFMFNSNLRKLYLDNLQNLSAIHLHAFDGLAKLTTLQMANNPALQFVQPNTFQSLGSLQYLDLSRNNLMSLHPGMFQGMDKLTELALHHNPWTCDCLLQWLPLWLNSSGVKFSHDQADQVKCSSPAQYYSYSVFDFGMEDLNCTNVSIVSYSLDVHPRFGATALLECQAVGNPPPSVTWILPRNHQIFHWYPSNVQSHWYLPFQFDHPPVHDKDGTSQDKELAERVKVLNNGNLYISQVLNVDAGTYLCLASNSLANDTVQIHLTLNYQILIQVKIVSILVGMATSVAALLLLLIFQLVHMALNRWGCCCCQNYMSPKAKQIMKILEGVEQYKTQQLDRLRDNYTSQVNRIKDNCNQQMERIRDTYGAQTDRLRDIREYGSHQLGCVRDQYYDQVKKVRDYSYQQMSKVRENYVFQRNRIRKFSAHQLIRLRENYKLQQQHLNKILETLNLENCRSGSSRSESMVFNPDDIMETVFIDHLPPAVLRRDFDDSDRQSDNSGYFTPNESSSPTSARYLQSSSSTPTHSCEETAVMDAMPSEEEQLPTSTASDGSSAIQQAADLKEAHSLEQLSPVSTWVEMEPSPSAVDVNEQVKLLFPPASVHRKLPNNASRNDSEPHEESRLLVDATNTVIDESKETIV